MRINKVGGGGKAKDQTEISGGAGTTQEVTASTPAADASAVQNAGEPDGPAGAGDGGEGTVGAEGTEGTKGTQGTEAEVGALPRPEGGAPGNSLTWSHAKQEAYARGLYTTYCVMVGGRDFNGDPLPDWETFKEDPEKQLQVRAWARLGLNVAVTIDAVRAGAISTEEATQGTQETERAHRERQPLAQAIRFPSGQRVVLAHVAAYEPGGDAGIAFHNDEGKELLRVSAPLEGNTVEQRQQWQWEMLALLDIHFGISGTVSISRMGWKPE